MENQTKKRPLGLKAQRKKGIDQKKPRHQEQDFTTVALLKTTEEETTREDGLTEGDLVQLKVQAEELIDNPSGMDPEKDQLVNLLRGICHEAIRQIEISEKDDGRSKPLPHQFIAWASLELGLFLHLEDKSERFLQPDEPDSFDGWLALASQVLLKSPPMLPADQPDHLQPDLELLPHSIALFKAQAPEEILKSLGTVLEADPKTDGCSNYVLRTIDRVILLKSELIAQDPTPIFGLLVDFLSKISPPSPPPKDQSAAQEFLRLIDLRLADCYLAHGSLLADQLEKLYYPHDDPADAEDDEKDQEEEFKIDVESPTYKLSLETLKLAEQTFSNLLVDMDDSDDTRDLLRSKLDETLLTMGNLLPPGLEREELYHRAGLGKDDE